MAIQRGTAGPGGAKYGMGAGGSARFDFQQPGSGLWSSGIDPNSPDAEKLAQITLSNLPAGERSKAMGLIGSAGGSVAGALDAYYRGVARDIQKPKRGIGGFLKGLLTVGSAFLPGGQFIAPAVGATLGGIDGGLKGAALGGLGGLAAGKGAGFLKGAAAKAGGTAALKASPSAFLKNVGGQAVGAAKETITKPFTALTGGTKAGATALPGGAPRASGGISTLQGAGQGGARFGAVGAGLQTAAPTTSAAAVAPSMLSKAYDALIKPNIAALPFLGLTAVQAFKGPQTTTGEKTVMAQNAQTNALTNQLINRYQSGALDPNDDRAIEEWRRGSRAQVEQFFVNSGIPDSTQKLDMLRDIDAKAVAMRDQVRQNYASAAMTGANVSSNAALALGQLQNLGDNQTSQALQNLLQAAALTMGRGQSLPTGEA